MDYDYTYPQRGMLRLQEVTQLANCPIAGLNGRARHWTQASLTPKLRLFPAEPGQENQTGRRRSRKKQVSWISTFKGINF